MQHGGDEILDRLRLIEAMMAEGRRTTQSWGWVFLLWGAGALFAILWETRWTHAEWSWPLTMGVCVIVNGVVLRLRKQRASTTTMRSLSAVWACAGVTVLLLTMGAVWSGMIDVRFIYATVFSLAAMAHGTCSLILRWRSQFLTAVVWWIASVMAFVVPSDRLAGLAAVALVLGNVAFGGWLSYCEWSRRDG